MRQITVKNICKSYDDEKVLENLNLTIPSGKFFALLGPSGCGKTTLLRLIAGLEKENSGKIFLGNQDITNVPIYERKINTVFQQYALFPHLSVFENIAYGLKLKKLKNSIIRERVFKALSTVRLLGFEPKRISSLSGGQQQRIAIARAIVNEPEVLLLDEPFAALDQQLKEQMLVELIDLQDKLKTTFVYVTHDQTEALTVADKMAIMNRNGKIEQIDSPKNIYEFPSTTFIANFVGKTNLFEGIFQKKENGMLMQIDKLGQFEVFISRKKDWLQSGNKIFMSIRPEKILISKKTISGFSNHLQGKVEEIIYHGRATQYNVKIADGRILKVFEQNEEHFPSENIDYDDKVNLYFQKENVVLLES